VREEERVLNDVFGLIRPDDSRRHPEGGLPVTGDEILEGEIVPADRRDDQGLVVAGLHSDPRGLVLV
jgi:hypothetical protein